VQLEILPPITNWSDVAARFEVYRTDMMDIAAATRFTESLRQTYRIRSRGDANSVHAAHASTYALRAARHKLAGPSGPQEALMLNSAQSARPSKHERGLT
jgi:hypothetical protein